MAMLRLERYQSYFQTPAGSPVKNKLDEIGDRHPRRQSPEQIRLKYQEKAILYNGVYNVMQYCVVGQVNNSVINR
jgi:hypothetical protein